MISKTISTFDNLLPIEDADGIRRVWEAIKAMSPYEAEKILVDALQEHVGNHVCFIIAAPLPETHAETELGTHTIISGGEVLELSHKPIDFDEPSDEELPY